MSQYPCSGCGLRHCDGRCYHESRADYETPQEAHKRRVAFWKALDTEQFTSCESDPLLRKFG